MKGGWEFSKISFFRGWGEKISEPLIFLSKEWLLKNEDSLSMQQLIFDFSFFLLPVVLNFVWAAWTTPTKNIWPDRSHSWWLLLRTGYRGGPPCKNLWQGRKTWVPGCGLGEGVQILTHPQGGNPGIAPCWWKTVALTQWLLQPSISEAPTVWGWTVLLQRRDMIAWTWTSGHGLSSFRLSCWREQWQWSSQQWCRSSKERWEQHPQHCSIQDLSWPQRRLFECPAAWGGSLGSRGHWKSAPRPSEVLNFELECWQS